MKHRSKTNNDGIRVESNLKYLIVFIYGLLSDFWIGVTPNKDKLEPQNFID